MLYKTEEFYAVGHSGDILDAGMRAKLHWEYWEYPKHPHTVKGNHGPVFVYRTLSTARRKYDEMCKAALAERAARIEERATIAKRAKAGDLAAALELGLDW